MHIDNICTETVQCRTLFQSVYILLTNHYYIITYVKIKLFSPGDMPIYRITISMCNDVTDKHLSTYISLSLKCICVDAVCIIEVHVVIQCLTATAKNNKHKMYSLQLIYLTMSL